MKRETIILGYKDYGEYGKVPVILCKKRTDINLIGAMKFYCNFCKKNHYHGIGEGHRIAHCHNEKSPYNKTGYIITLNKNYF